MAQPIIEVPELTDSEMKEIRNHVSGIKAILKDKFINLEPADRQRYGSISEQNKLIVNKVKDYEINMPELADPKVDWDAFKRNHTTRTNYHFAMDLMNEILELCDDPSTLVDYVLYGQASKDYKWAKYNAEDDGGTGTGYEAKYEDLKQFFTRSTDSKADEPEAPTA